MSKFFKSLLLLLSAGLFVATGWANDYLDKYTFTGGTTSPVLAPEGGWTFGGVTVSNLDDPALKDTGAVKTDGTIIAPGTNVGNGNTWEMTFNAPTGGVANITSINFDVVMYNNSGNAQGTDTTRNVTFTLYKDGDTTTEIGKVEDIAMTGKGNLTTATNGAVVINFATPVTINTSLTIKAERGTTTTGCFFGLKTLGITATVPEAVWKWDGTGGTETGTRLASGEKVYSVDALQFSSADFETPIAPNAFTYSFWAKQSSDDWSNLSGISINDTGFVMQHKASTSTYVALYGIGVTLTVDDAFQCSVTDGVLDLITMVNDNGVFTFYRNGVQETSTDLSGTVTGATSTDTTLPVLFTLGGAPDSSLNPDPDPLVADARFYSTALTAAEVRLAYLESLVPKVATYTAEISENVNFSEIDFGDTVTENDLVALTATADATVTIDTAFATVNGLTLKGEDFIIATDGTNKLTASTTTINANTTVNAGAASLGAVTIGEGKTLTVKDNATVGTVASNSGSLCLDGGTVTLTNAGTGTYTVANGGALTLPSNFPTTTSVSVSGGSEDTPNALTQDTKDGSFGTVTVAENSVLELCVTDNTKVNVTGANVDTSIVRLVATDDASWGVTNDENNTKVSNITLKVTRETPTAATNIEFWHERSSFLNDGSCNLIIDDGINFRLAGADLSVRNLSGVGDITNGTNSVTVAPASACQYDGAIKSNAPLTVNGNAPLTLTGAHNSSALLTVEGALIFSGSGSWAGAITNNGNLTYTSSVTPTNTITNNGTIVADTAIVDLTGATLDGSGTYGVTNGGTLILPVAATAGKTIDVPVGATLKVMLTAAQQLLDQTVTVTGTGTVLFVDESGESLGEAGNSYTAPLNTWTATTDSTWATTTNWSTGALPTTDDAICINITADTTITLAEAVTVKSVVVKGTGTLTIDGAVLTVTEEIIAQTNVDGGANLSFTKLEMTADTVEVSVANADEMVLNSIEGGIFTKTGAGTLKMATATDPVFKNATVNINEGGLYTCETSGGVILDGATLNFATNTTWQGHGWVTLNNRVTIDMDHDIEFTAGDGITPSFANDDTGTLVKDGSGKFTFSLRGSSKNFPIVINGGSIAPYEENNDTCAISGVISGAGKVVIEGPTPIALTGANTYTGGTEVVAGATLKAQLRSDTPMVINGTLEATYSGEKRIYSSNFSQVTGTGKIKIVNTNGWVLLPSSAKNFASTLALENEVANGLILSTAGDTYEFGTLSGSKAFRMDWGGDTRIVRVLQAANSEHTGALLWTSNSPERCEKIVIAGATGAENKTLTLSGTTTFLALLEIDATGSVNLTGSVANALTNNGILAGTGTVSGALTFGDGATLDVTAGTPLTVTGAVTFGATLNVTVTGDIAGQQILTKADANITEETAVEGLTVLVNGAEGYYVAQTAEGYVLREVITNPTLSADVAGGVTTLSALLGENELEADTILTINFGDKGEGEANPGTFTFDNETDVAFSQIIVTGTNGGTIAKADGAGTVATAAMTVEEGAVTIPASTLTATATTIAAEATLAVADVTTVTAIEGAGVLEMSVYPASSVNNYSANTTVTGLTEETWTGTLRLNANGTIAQNGLRFDLLGNANSTIEIAEGTTVDGYFGLINASTGWTADADLILSGTIAVTNGFTGKSYVFAGDLTGSGTLSLETKTMTETFYFSGDVSAFEGTITLATGRSVVFGSTSVAGAAGKIVLASSVKIGSTWTSGSGFAIQLPEDTTLDLNGQNLTVSELTCAGTITDSSATAGAITVQGGAINITGTCDVAVTVDLSTYSDPITFVVPDATTFNTTGVLASGLTYDAETKSITLNPFENTLSDELIWLPVGDSITEGEQYMGHADSGDVNSRGGYRYQVWKQLDAREQPTRSVGFRTGHSGTVEDPATTPWAWHAGLYGGDITPGSSSAQLYNVETTLEVAGYPDVISVLIGINDLSRTGGGDTDEARAKVYGAWAALIDRYAKLRPNTKVLAATLLPVATGNATDNDFGPFNELVRAAAAARTTPFDNANVVLVDVCEEAFNNTYNASYFKDAVHPNETGAVLVANVFSEAIYNNVILPLKTATPTIVHVDNATADVITVRFNKKIDSTTATELTLSGTNLAGEEVSITCTTPTIDGRVMTFALPAETNLIAGTYTVTLNGKVTSADAVTTTETVTASGATVEIFGTGAAANVPTSFREGFIHRNTLNVEENPYYEGNAPAMDVINSDEIESVAKVGYYVELQRAGQAPQFIWVSMDAAAFNNSEACASIPTTAVGTIKSLVTDLAVYGNRGNFTKSITGGRGVIEFSPYTIAATDESIDGWPTEMQSGAFGWNDTHATSGGFGAMQVARIRTERDSTKDNKYDPEAEMLFAFNGFNYADATHTDLGIGSFSVHCNNAGGQFSSKYDWTNLYADSNYEKFATSAYSVRKIELWVLPTPAATIAATINVGTGDGQYTTWSAAQAALGLANDLETVTLNFAEATTFTFDNTEEITIEALTVTAEDAVQGGTIAVTNATVLASTSATIDTAVTVEGQLQLNGMTINADATLTITNYAVIGDQVDGTGVLSITEATLTEGLDVKLVKDTWTGTVVLNKVQDKKLDLAKLVNAESNLTLEGDVQAYIYNCSMNTLTVNGSFRGVNGTSNSSLCQRAVIAELMGAGTIYGHTTNDGASPSYVDLIFTSADTFTGTINLEGDTSIGTTVCFGSAGRRGGTIVFSTDSDAVVPEGKIWTAVNGVYVHAEGTIAGTGTLEIPEGKAFLYESSGDSTFSGTISGSGALTVNATGILTLGGKNSYTGGTTIATGATLKLGVVDALGTGEVAVNGTLDLNTLTWETAILTGSGLVTNGSVTITGETTFSGGLSEINTLEISEGATFTLNGNQNATVSLIAGSGDLVLKLQGATANAANNEFTLTGTSTFAGSILVAERSTLKLTGQEASPITLNVTNALTFNGLFACLNTTWASVTIKDGATLTPNAVDHVADMVIEAGVTLDCSNNGNLKLDQVTLPSGEEGAIKVKAVQTGVIIQTEEALQDGIGESNFTLTDDSADNLYFFINTTSNMISIVEAVTDFTNMSEDEKRAILYTGSLYGVPVGEIANSGVPLIFEGSFNGAYGHEWTPVVDEDGDLVQMDITYSVNFGISAISNVSIVTIEEEGQEVEKIQADLTALVKPIAEDASVSFKTGVTLDLYLEGKDAPLQKVSITEADTTSVSFEDVLLPSDVGTRKIKVKASNSQ